MPHLRRFWQPHVKRWLVEPFCGGLAVTLGLRPERAVLNDANPHLINFYQWLQRGLRVTLAMENKETAYYRNRDRFNAILERGRHDTAEAAALFYYLNRTGTTDSAGSIEAEALTFRSGDTPTSTTRQISRATETRSRTGRSPREILKAYPWSGEILSTPIRPTMWSSRIRDWRFSWDDQERTAVAWRAIVAQPCSSIRPQSASKSSTENLGIAWTSWTLHAGLVAPATVPRLKRLSAPGTCDAAKYEHRGRAGGHGVAGAYARRLRLRQAVLGWHAVRRWRPQG